jgi:anti-anti-sigma regulatory factor
LKRTLEIKLVERRPAIILQLSGEIGPLSHIDLLEAAQSVVASELPVVILDFSEVEYVNSAGLSGLILFLARLGQRGQVVYASGLSGHERIIFTVMRLTEYVRLASDPQAAFNDYAKNYPKVPSIYLSPEAGHEHPQL